MSSGIIETIKEVAINTYEATNPVALLFGKVISTNPIKIQVGENLTLTKEFLVINGSVSNGDEVTLIRCQGGQKYVALGTRTVSIENTVYVGGGEASSTSTKASGNWQYPFKGSYVTTSPFGWRRLNGVNGYHKGVDLVGTSSKHIYPVNNGKVVSVVGGWGGGYGNHVIIDHGNGIWSLYAHMSRVNVKNGQTVNKNTIIGVEGSTGHSTGSHLHLEIRKSLWGSQIDPVPFLNKN